MISKLFSRRAAPRSARVPGGRRLYAIGDIHGRLDLLDGLLESIVRDERARGGAEAELIFLGDLVDRGPDSAGVIDRLMTLATERPGTRFILGNHEEVFLNALSGDLRALRFLNRFGGEETMLSYGIAPEVYAEADFAELARLLDAAVPEAHRRFLANFEDMIVAGDYLFVHAGIRPGVPLATQQVQDLRWIREDFFAANQFEKVVVHGHTITDEVVDLPHRIGLDTGAYRSGLLSAMGFEGGERWLVQERGSPAI